MPRTERVTEPEVDWEAVSVASSLGRSTLERVAQRDAGAVREWAMQME